MPPSAAMRLAAPPAALARPARRPRPPRGGAACAALRGASSPDGSWTPAAGSALGGALNGLFRAASAREPVQAGTPALRTPARELTAAEIASDGTQALIEEMVAVCRARGVGLAAPQLGESVAIVVLEDTTEDVSAEDKAAQERSAFPLKVLINPRVTARPGSAFVAFFEGCLSVQGYRGLVSRALEVDVTALGGDGTPVAFTARGWQARILQHEYDHLQGTLYIDRMVTRTFRRVDLIAQPLPPPSAEFGPCPPLGAQTKGFGGAGGAAAAKRPAAGGKGGFKR